jgi:hypothetical protein
MAPAGLPVSSRRFMSASAEGGDHLLAGLLTTSARLCADPAVFVHPGVPLALVGAGPAGGHAGLEHGAGEVGVVAGVPGQHPARGVADFSAVPAGADALDQVGDPGLAQARVGARGTGLGAVEAFLDTPDQGPRGRHRRGRPGRCAASPLRGSLDRYLPSSMLDFVGQYPLRGNSQRPPGGSLQSSAESRSAAADCFAMATGHSDAGVHRLSQRALTSPSKTKGSSRTVRCACATARPVASQPQVSPVGRVPWRDVSIRICLLEDGVFALRLAGESRGLRPFCVITGGPGAGPRPGASGRGCWVQLSSIRIRRRSMNRHRCWCRSTGTWPSHPSGLREGGRAPGPGQRGRGSPGRA